MIMQWIGDGKNMKQVISCSRRTDIPAFYYGWLQNVLEAGSVKMINHYNDKEYTVDLTPENVHSIVLWSKDFRNVAENPQNLDKYNLYFQYTITGRGGTKFEPHAPKFDQSFRTMATLANTYGGDKINWRFDPLFVEEGHDPKKLVVVFKKLSSKAAECGVKRCTISFVEFYGKVKTRLQQHGIDLVVLPEEQKVAISQELVDIAKSLDMTVHCCAQEFEDQVSSCDHNGCIDSSILTDLYGGKITAAKDQSQRKLCKCTKSVDIGSYKEHPCWFLCKYCYANG